MKAVVCKAWGPPESLVIEDRPPLEAGPGKVVVSVKAASVKFSDTLVIQNKYQTKPELPFIPGSEVTGVLKSIGAGVEGGKAEGKIKPHIWATYPLEKAADALNALAGRKVAGKVILMTEA